MPHDVDELGMYGLCHMIKPHIHKYKAPNTRHDYINAPVDNTRPLYLTRAPLVVLITN